MMRGNTGILLAALAVGCTETIPTQPDLGFAAAASTSVVKVTNNNDAGPGSFRAGVETANLTGTVHTIQFRSGVGPVLLQSTVTYTGTQQLRIEGSGAVLDGADAGGNAFASTGGGDLELRRITVQNAPAVGVYVEVPFNATGVVRVALHEVTLQDNFLYGLHVDDRLGGEGNGADSPAGIVLDVQGSAVLRNNSPQAGKDYDGIRVDEGGDGDIDARVQHSTFSDNLADGLELDEAGSGDARVFVRQSHFDFNGQQPQDTDDPEDGVDVDEAGPGDLVLDVAQTTAIGNLDDGIDMDEDGEGTLIVRISQVDVSGSGNDGIALTEDEFNQIGAGGVHATLIGVTASDIGDRGLDSDEWGDGDIVVNINNSHFDRNGADGLRLEEDASGDVHFIATNTTFNGNGDEGVQIAEVGGGSAEASFTNSQLSDNVGHGTQLEEEDDGDLNALLTNSTVNNNQVDGINVDQGDAGVGVLRLVNTQVTGNGDDDIDDSGVTVIQN